MMTRQLYFCSIIYTIINLTNRFILTVFDLRNIYIFVDMEEG